MLGAAGGRNNEAIDTLSDGLLSWPVCGLVARPQIAPGPNPHALKVSYTSCGCFLSRLSKPQEVAMPRTCSEKGKRWRERLWSWRHTYHIRGHLAFPMLVEAVSCLYKDEGLDPGWLTQQISLPVPSMP
jgi:hypothetical protein